MTLTEERGTLSPSCIPYLPPPFSSFHSRERERRRNIFSHHLGETALKGTGFEADVQSFSMEGRTISPYLKITQETDLTASDLSSRRSAGVKILPFINLFLRWDWGKLSSSEDGLNKIMLISIGKLIKNKWKAETSASVGTWNSIIYHSNGPDSNESHISGLGRWNGGLSLA